MFHYEDNIDLYFENRTKYYCTSPFVFTRFKLFHLVVLEIARFPTILKNARFSYRLARHLQKEAQAQHNNSEFTEEQKVP